MSAPFLISKAIDPFFAIGVGISAAAVRINREEKEKGKSTQQSVESLKRRVGMAMEGLGSGEGKDGGKEKGAG